MSAKRYMSDEDFNGIMEGLGEAKRFAAGEDVPDMRVHIPAEIDIKAIRGRLGLSQEAFARRFHFSGARVRDWEQGRRVPDSGVRAYLRVIAAEPEVVVRVLETA